MSSIRLLIVDDVPDVRRELSVLLSLVGDIIVCGEAADGVEAIRKAEDLRPDVVLMDLEMPRMDGIEAAQKIKLVHPECRVIALTIHDSPADRAQCVQAGMESLFTKGAPLDELLQAIRHAGPEILNHKSGDTK